MAKMPDGSNISSYFDLKGQTTGQDVSKDGMSFKIGQVEKIHFIDDQSNVSKKFVEYDVSVRDQNGGQSMYRNVRHMSTVFGTNDFDETILEPNEFAFSGKLDTSNFFTNKNGTIVLIAHIHGSKDKPVIIGSIVHPKKRGAKRADGIRKLGEFRGVEWNINKDGELIITQRGPRSPNGDLKTNDKVNTVIKLDKEGNVSVADKEENKIYLDRENKKIVVSQQDTNKITMDRTASTIELAAGNSGLKILLDGQADKATYITAAGVKVEISGSGTITLTANSTVITIDGNSGKISLTGQLVDVGAAASALAMLGPQMVAWATSHIHNAPQAPTGVLPTTPPIVPPPASVMSTTVRIKP